MVFNVFGGFFLLLFFYAQSSFPLFIVNCKPFKKKAMNLGEINI